MTLAQMIIADMDAHPNDYAYDDGYTIVNSRAGFSLWVFSGRGYYSIWSGLGVRGGFGFFDQFRFHFALKRWKQARGKVILRGHQIALEAILGAARRPGGWR